MITFENRTNKKFLVQMIGPCPRCGFGGKVNDWEEAKKRGEMGHVIDCPECGGKGEQISTIPLEEALNHLTTRSSSR